MTTIVIVVLVAAVMLGALGVAVRRYMVRQIPIDTRDRREECAPSQSVTWVRRLLANYDHELERRADVEATRRALHDLRRGADRHVG